MEVPQKVPYRRCLSSQVLRRLEFLLFTFIHSGNRVQTVKGVSKPYSPGKVGTFRSRVEEEPDGEKDPASRLWASLHTEVGHEGSQ